jgi:hypothetical protein
VSSLLYTAELSLDPEDRHAFLQWYAYKHAPDLFPIGFQSCACYEAVMGDMTYFDIYEIPSREIFNSPGYRRMNELDVYAVDILAKRRDKAHTLYQHQYLYSRNGKTGPIDADWLTVFRFDTDAADADLNGALDKEARRLAGLGATNVRMAIRTQDHPIYTTHRPRCMLLAEWSADPGADTLFKFLEEQFSGKMSATVKLVGKRVFPWPNARI